MHVCVPVYLCVHVCVCVCHRSMADDLMSVQSLVSPMAAYLSRSTTGAMVSCDTHTHTHTQAPESHTHMYPDTFVFHFVNARVACVFWRYPER